MVSRELKAGFQGLEIWKSCRDIRLKIFELCKTFPKEEKYRLVDQLIRASRSAAVCIAEGYGRLHYQENIQFCRQSRGSLYELMDHLLVCKECHYMRPQEVETLVEEIELAVKLLNGYIKCLKKRKASES